MQKTANQIGYEVLEKLAFGFGTSFETADAGGSGAVKKEYMRLRDLATQYPKPGNVSAFKKFKEQATPKYKERFSKWEEEEPRSSTGAFGVRWGK